MKQIRWGFIGCGEVTEKKSGPAFNEVEGSCVVAVMSRNEERVKAYAKRHNIPKWYTDAQEARRRPGRQCRLHRYASILSCYIRYHVYAVGEAMLCRKTIGGQL